MPRQKTSTTRLPSTLLDEINQKSSDTAPQHRRGKQKLSRKESRKQERNTKKQRKAEFFTGSKRHVEEEHRDAPVPKKIKLNLPKLPETVNPKPKKQTPLEKLATKPLRSQKEIDDDRYIAYLESKLGSGKARKGAEDDDGLDDLLDFTNTIGSFTADDEMGDVTENDDDGDEELELEDFDTSDEEDEWTGIGTISEPEPEEPDDAPAPTPVSTVYVPPHLRKTLQDSEELVKLRRTLKGLLNRMSEQNLASILDSIEELYRKHSRNDVTSTITFLIIDGIASHSLLLDSYVVLHATFVASLHKTLGIEFAANFVQNVVSNYEMHYAAIEEDNENDTKGKECSNLVILLSELYNFQVISCILVFDIIRGLLANTITEFNVELLLKLIRTSGQQLRLDDPSALKDIAQIVQDKVTASGEAPSSRTQFMVETLMNLKNNKLKKAGTQNQGGEAVERMKKFLSSLGKKKHVLANEPLRVSLADLHSAETKGKWWLVGAAWGGDPLVDRPQPEQAAKPAEPSANNALLKLARKQGMNTDIRRGIFVVLMSSDDYIDACDRLSQLNLTEIQQREIVRVLLHCCGNEKTYNPYYTLVCQNLCKSSHSYKITLQFCLWDFLRDLGETEVGGAEVIKSIKETGGVERFELNSISWTRLKNVARAYGWWIAKDSVTLAVLKPVDFTSIKTPGKEFLVELFNQLFISSQVSTPLFLASNQVDFMANKNRGALEDIFMKATRVQALSMGLVYFLSSAFKDHSDKFTRWAVEVGKDRLRTGVDV